MRTCIAKNARVCMFAAVRPSPAWARVQPVEAQTGVAVAIFACELCNMAHQARRGSSIGGRQLDLDIRDNGGVLHAFLRNLCQHRESLLLVHDEDRCRPHLRVAEARTLLAVPDIARRCVSWTAVELRILGLRQVAAGLIFSVDVKVTIAHRKQEHARSGWPE